MAMNIRVTKIEAEGGLLRTSQKMTIWFIVSSDIANIDIKIDVVASSFDDGVSKARAKLNQLASDLLKETAPQPLASGTAAP